MILMMKQINLIKIYKKVKYNCKKALKNINKFSLHKVKPLKNELFIYII